MTKIKIKEQEYELKYSIRVLFVFERITGKAFDPTKLFDLYMYFYSCLVANNQNFTMLVDEFLDECDNNPQIFEEFISFFQRAIQFQNQTANKDEVTEDDDKKKE